VSDRAVHPADPRQVVGEHVQPHAIPHARPVGSVSGNLWMSNVFPPYEVHSHRTVRAAAQRRRRSTRPLPERAERLFTARHYQYDSLACSITYRLWQAARSRHSDRALSWPRKRSLPAC